jgi:hypothetical protein
MLGKVCSIHGAKQKAIRISAVKHYRPLLRGKLKSEGDSEMDNSCPSHKGEIF